MRRDNSKETLFAVDIGNTNISCGVYLDGEMAWFGRLFSSTQRTADEYYSLLCPLLDRVPGMKISHIVFASVVPELTKIWQRLFQKYIPVPVTQINALSKLGLSFHVADPSFIGADLIANAFGAWKKYGTNCIIIDLGTATKVQLVSETGQFEGTAIAPGLKTSAEQLASKAAQLSQIEIAAPSVLFGTNTRDSMLSGIVHGHAFMLEAYIRKVKEQYCAGKKVVTVITGGIAELLVPLIPSIDVLDKTLTLDGLHLAFQQLTRK
jgi:type III pantothenate kinase